jgi:signal transduction histidine kinase
MDEAKFHNLEAAIEQIDIGDRLSTGDKDLRGLEDAINDLLARMHAAYRQQAQFVSDASHELRTPIAVIQGYVKMLDRWGKDDEKVLDESIAAIKTETEHMKTLVEQLLFLARGDSGRTPLQPRPTDLTELVREVWEESRMIDPDHQWVLDAPQPVPCTCAPDMIKQALRILSDNAAKYPPAGKTITLRSFVNPEGSPCLAVRDEGIGIKTEDAAHVFDRFYRSDRARTRQSGGAGLGLAIANWIVTQHNGHLEVYSWEGIGSRFTMVLGK